VSESVIGSAVRVKSPAGNVGSSNGQLLPAFPASTPQGQAEEVGASRSSALRPRLAGEVIRWRGEVSESVAGSAARVESPAGNGGSSTG
jgi:hypothetical protein